MLPLIERQLIIINIIYIQLQLQITLSKCINDTKCTQKESLDKLIQNRDVHGGVFAETAVWIGHHIYTSIIIIDSIRMKMEKIMEAKEGYSALYENIKMISGDSNDLDLDVDSICYDKELSLICAVCITISLKKLEDILSGNISLEVQSNNIYTMITLQGKMLECFIRCGSQFTCKLEKPIYDPPFYNYFLEDQSAKEELQFNKKSENLQTSTIIKIKQLLKELDDTDNMKLLEKVNTKLESRSDI